MHKKPPEAYSELQKQCFGLKFVEMGKVRENSAHGRLCVTLLFFFLGDADVGYLEERESGGAEGGVFARGPHEAAVVPQESPGVRAGPLRQRRYGKGGRKVLGKDAQMSKFSLQSPQELYGLDVLHKFNWIRLIARMFEAMAGNFAHPSDIHLFLNVINGALALHSEDSCILRYCMATLINAAAQFKNIFSGSGYFLVMPNLLRIYSNSQTNELVAR